MSSPFFSAKSVARVKKIVKNKTKKKKKIVGTHQAKLAPEARRTKTFSTRILQESFACGSCFTHVL